MNDDSNKVRHFPRNADAKKVTVGQPEIVEAPAAQPNEPQQQEAAPRPQVQKSEGAPVKAKRGGVRKIVLPVIGLAVLAGAGWFGYQYYTVGRFMVTTDDAYVLGDITTISPKVSGYVAMVNVVANQQVKEGDVLVTLDDGDYRIARDQAQAQIDTQKLTLTRVDAQVEGARAAVTQAEAQKTSLQAAQRNASISFDRTTQLASKNVIAQSGLDTATASLDQANANLAAANAQIASANAAITVLQAQRAEALSGIKSYELAMQKAERDLGFTVLRAPYDGVVGNLAVQKGDLVSTGARLAAIVPVNQLYIEANFKETQLSRLVAGEKVEIRVDAMEDEPFYGTVQSLAPASGSVFSLLPAENATGNFTKVVQRVPVRIDLPAEALASGKFRAGLSVVVSADTRTAPAK